MRSKQWHPGPMTTSPAALYKGFQFPQHILAHAVWLYFRFNLSYRDVEALLAQRGVVVTYSGGQKH